MDSQSDFSENSDKQNARIEHDKALGRVMTAVFKDDIDLLKHFDRQREFQTLAVRLRVCWDIQDSRLKLIPDAEFLQKKTRTKVVSRSILFTLRTIRIKTVYTAAATPSS